MSNDLPKATHQGVVRIRDIEIPCAVLNDGTRIIRERSVAKILGKKGSGGYWARKRNPGNDAILPEYVSAKYLEPFISVDVRINLLNPIRYRTKSGSEGWGVSAALLPEICNIWLTARDQHALNDEQLLTAQKADVLMRGLAHIGIIALIDEATGYQEVRDRNALERILEKWIAKELLAWTKQFPDDFYRHMFRLRGWQYKPLTVKRPQVVGHYTNDIVYERLETGVLEELKKKNPIVTKGYRKNRHHQWLTEDVGHPKLRDHLNGVMALMKASANWNIFLRLLNRAYPRKGATLEMPLDDLEGR